MHPFDASLELDPAAGAPQVDPATFRARTSTRYRNAIGPFGGWTAALLVKGVLSMPEARGHPLSLDAIFMGPIDDGELEVRVSRLRQNRSVGFWRAEIWQHARMCAHAQIALSLSRSGSLLQDAQAPAMPPPDEIPVYVNPREPVPWIEQYVFKPVHGFLFSRAESMDALTWVRDAVPRPLDAISLTALCDTPFPSPWIRLDSQTPVSTVSFSVYYRAAGAALAQVGDDFVLMESRAAVMRDGYVDQFTHLWSRAGRLLAQTQQMLWVSG